MQIGRNHPFERQSMADLSIREITKPFLEEVIIAIDPEGRGFFCVYEERAGRPPDCR